MPGRFEDPAVERAYVEGERRARKTFAAQRALGANLRCEKGAQSRFLGFVQAPVPVQIVSREPRGVLSNLREQPLDFLFDARVHVPCLSCRLRQR